MKMGAKIFLTRITKKIITEISLACLLCGCSSGAQASSSDSVSHPAYTCRSVNYYDYTKPVPESETVDDSYWPTVFMGGDSRMGSLALYSDLRTKGADVQYAESLSLYRIYDMTVEGGTSPLYDLLVNTDRTNIYILLGLNEIRSDSFDDWGSMYDSLIQDIWKKNPNASIYIMGSYHCRSVSGLTADQLTKQLSMVNGKMQEIAEKEHCYYLDTDAGIVGDDGLVNSDYVWDDIHFNTAGSQAFADEIAKHVVREGSYVKKVCE
jgi:lysophospholipase L1-like esterase